MVDANTMAVPATKPSDDHDLHTAHEPKWPTHNAPRVWFLSRANSPIGVSLCRQILAHGDYAIAGVQALEFERDDDRSAEFRAFLASVGTDAEKESWRSRLRVVSVDARVPGQCQSAVAEAVQSVGRIDILFCCDSEVILGTVEELGQSPRTQTLVSQQFETNFFGPVNLIRATLPVLRAQQHGHIVLLSAISGHLGTPGLSMFCASQWALEGYCDSLAYEVAPFNIRVTIMQPNIEVTVLTSKITSAPPLSAYTEESHSGPSSRNILSNLLDRLEGTDEPTTGDQLHSNEVTSVYAPLTPVIKERLVVETVYAVAAIGGHDNPPTRHIIGHDSAAAVKEKLKNVSEELEDFVECSSAVDIERLHE